MNQRLERDANYTGIESRYFLALRKSWYTDTKTNSMPVILDTWNKLIGTTFNPSNPVLFTLPNESLQTFINQSEEEQEKVRALLIEGVIDKPIIRDKKQYIQVNQAIIIRLLDKIHSYKHCPKVNGKILFLYNSVSEHLENTLDFIEDFFSNYFDRNEKAPATYFNISIKELCKQFEILTKALQSNNNIDHQLENILTNNFNRFYIKTSGATYNELIYQKELMDELLSDNVLESELSIREVLFYFNFNDDDYLAYLYERLKGLTEILPGKKEKISKLLFEQKTMNQLATKPNRYLSSGMPSLKEQINHWIEEEVKFLKFETAQDLRKIELNKREYNVHVIFKGAEIYLLHKAFIDAGGAPTETYKSLLEKTSSNISNKNQKGFSTESLQKASDKVNPESKENIKRFLQRMIRNIDSYD